jgi:hypothetical protein
MDVLRGRCRIILIFLLGIGVLSGFFFDFDIHHNKRLGAHGFTKFPASSLLTCFRHCTDDNTCLSFVFTKSPQDELKNCELYSVNTQTSELVEADGYMYGEGKFTPAREKPKNNLGTETEPISSTDHDHDSDEHTTTEHIYRDDKTSEEYTETSYFTNEELHITATAVVDILTDLATVVTRMFTQREQTTTTYAGDTTYAGGTTDAGGTKDATRRGNHMCMY